MKIAVLSGAYTNSGDHLIVNRASALLRHVLPEVELLVYKRNHPLGDSLEMINQCKALLFAGGPVYQHSIYPDSIPLLSDLNQLKPRFFFLGLGWKGMENTNRIVYNYGFSESTMKLLRRADSDGYGLGCRDWLTVRALKHHGFCNTVMTGCPAWYNLDFLASNQAVDYRDHKISTICVSDNGYPLNENLLVALLRLLRDRYSDTTIKLVFHKKSSQAVIDAISGTNIQIVNISGSVDGFSVYDTCDLHIGFRVHAHIYNLSKGNVSVLIEEDGRGSGVNEALGITSIKCLAPNATSSFKFIGRIQNKLRWNQNSFFENELADKLDNLESSNYMEIERAFQTIKFSLRDMTSHISLLAN